MPTMLPRPPAPQPDLPGATQPGPRSLPVPRWVLIAGLGAGPLWPLPWGEAKELLFPLGGKKSQTGNLAEGTGPMAWTRGFVAAHTKLVCARAESHNLSSAQKCRSLLKQ